MTPLPSEVRRILDTWHMLPDGPHQLARALVDMLAEVERLSRPGSEVRTLLDERARAIAARYVSDSRGQESLTLDIIELFAALDVSCGGWQPMDTAPKDGTRIMVWGDFYGCRGIGTGYWFAGADGSSGWITSAIPGYDFSGSIGGDYLQGWRLLPQIPAHGGTGKATRPTPCQTCMAAGRLSERDGLWKTYEASVEGRTCPSCGGTGKASG